MLFGRLSRLMAIISSTERLSVTRSLPFPGKTDKIKCLLLSWVFYGCLVVRFWPGPLLAVSSHFSSFLLLDFFSLTAPFSSQLSEIGSSVNQVLVSSSQTRDSFSLIHLKFSPFFEHSLVSTFRLLEGATIPSTTTKLNGHYTHSSRTSSPS